MARKKSEVFVFSHIGQAEGPRFVPAGILGLTETDGANVQSRELASEFAYGTGYLGRKESFEIDPVSLAFGDRESIKGQALFPVNGLGDFGGIRDAAPDAWGRRVIEARLKAPANSLLEVQYLLCQRYSNFPHPWSFKFPHPVEDRTRRNERARP